MQIQGEDIVRWVISAPPDELKLLVGTDYSDISDEWRVIDVDPNGLRVSKIGSERIELKAFSFFRSGTFFIDIEEISNRICCLLRSSQEPWERELIRVKELLSSYGFSISELGGDGNVIALAAAVFEFTEHTVIPDGDDWLKVHEILSNSTVENKRVGAKHIKQWIDKAEEKLHGNFDVYRRVSLAHLYRHTGQLDKALIVSDVVDEPRHRLEGTNTSISVLCTTRAAAMMDLAEKQATQRNANLEKARLVLNKANANSGVDSSEIRAAYMRLNMLERQQ